MNKLLSYTALVCLAWIAMTLTVINADKTPTPARIEHHASAHEAMDTCCQGLCAIEPEPAQPITPPATPAATPAPQPAPTTTAPYTFGIIKPDAVQAGYTGDIVRLIELNGFEIVELQKRQLTLKEVQDFYAEHKGKPFFKDLTNFMTSGPVVVLKLKKNNAVGAWRKLMGATNPEKARVGTLRAMFGQDITHNAVHGSDSDASADRELAFFFSRSK